MDKNGRERRPHPDGSVDSSVVRQRNNKRRRVALACARCRTKKSRCDGSQPVCSMCSEMGYECVYQHPSSVRIMTESKEYDFPTVRSLNSPNLTTSRPPPGWENRLQALEERMRAFEATVLKNGAAGAMTTPESHITDRQLENADTGGISIEQEAVQDRGSVEDPVDAIGVIGFADEQGSGFYGPSSNIAFIGHISNAMVATRDLTFSSGQIRSETDTAMMNMARRSSSFTHHINNSGSSGDGVDLLALPPEHEILDLFQYYFQNTGLLYPYVHEESLYDTYAKVKLDDFRKVRRSWLGLLNMVLACAVCTKIGGQMEVEDRPAASDVFYQRALGLYKQQNMHGMNLEIVQYLLLMVLYLQGTQRSVQTWAIHGLAVKAALQLGLHSEEISRRFAPLEREIRKRTWYGCVILDRTLSMTFGRPASVPENYVKLELPSPMLVNQDAVPPSLSTTSHYTNGNDANTSVQFFNATITLYRTMWRIIDSLYEQNIGSGVADSPSEVVCRIVKLEQELTEWRYAQPEWLVIKNTVQSSESGTHTSTENRLRTILSLRYLNVRILLHRPIITKLLDQCGSPEANQDHFAIYRQMGSNSVHLCLESAMQIISLVHAAGERRASLGAWWFSLYYTFNAALVIFSISLIYTEIPDIAPSRPDTTNKMKNSFRLAVEALEKLDAGNPMIDRCRRYLTRQLEMGLPRESAPKNQNLGEPLYSDPARPTSRPVSGQHQQAQAQAMLSDFDSWSPLGMELGEFMMESNLDLLSDLFEPSTQRI